MTKILRVEVDSDWRIDKGNAVQLYISQGDGVETSLERHVPVQPQRVR